MTLADKNDPHISAARLLKRANDMVDPANPAYAWISQNIAHIDVSKRAPMLTWAQCEAVLDASRELFGHLNWILTGCFGYSPPPLDNDWEYHLMIPWMPMSPRVAGLIEDGHFPKHPV